MAKSTAMTPEEQARFIAADPGPSVQLHVRIPPGLYRAIKIRAAGYDAKSQVLEIEFSDGKLIQYRGVSPEVHRQFMAAPSATSFFEDKIDETFPSSRIK